MGNSNKNIKELEDTLKILADRLSKQFYNSSEEEYLKDLDFIINIYEENSILREDLIMFNTKNINIKYRLNEASLSNFLYILSQLPCYNLNSDLTDKLIKVIDIYNELLENKEFLTLFREFTNTALIRHFQKLKNDNFLKKISKIYF